MRFSHTVNPDKIAYYLDGVTLSDSTVRLSGWALSTKGTVCFSVFSDGKEIPIEVRRTHLLDISRTVLKNDSQPDCGFRITFENPGTAHCVLRLGDGVQTAKIKVDLTGGFKKRTWRPRAAEDYGKHLSLIPGAVKEEGLGRFVKELRGDVLSDDKRYEKWLLKNVPSEEELTAERETKFHYAPRVSIAVPVYKTPEKFLREMIESFENQTYGNWELLIADGSGTDEAPEKIIREYMEKDSRIVYQKLERNGGISENTNAAAAMASGEWLGLMDHDDLVTPNLLFEAVKAMNEDPEITALYTDEGKISMDGSFHFRPVFKPDFDGTYLASGNYICHFFMVRRDIAEQKGVFDPACDGAQDLDYILRCTEDGKVKHLPKILYHWRCHPNSTADDPQSKMYCYENGNRAVQKHLSRTGRRATSYVCSVYGHYATMFHAPETSPRVSVVLWGEGGEEDFEKSEKSVRENGYPLEYEFLRGVDAVKNATGEYLFFMKAGSTLEPFDYSLLEKSFLPENTDLRPFPLNLLGRLSEENAGLCGVKVLDRNGLYVYGGGYRNRYHGVDYYPRRIFGNSTLFGGKFLDAKETAFAGEFGFMISKERFMSPEKQPDFSNPYWAEDLSLTLTEKGYKHFYEPFVTVKTDFSEPKKAKHRRHPGEAKALTEKHSELLRETDPAINENCMIHMERWVLIDGKREKE